MNYIDQLILVKTILLLAFALQIMVYFKYICYVIVYSKHDKNLSYEHTCQSIKKVHIVYDCNTVSVYQNVDFRYFKDT